MAVKVCLVKAKYEESFQVGKSVKYSDIGCCNGTTG